MANNLFIFYLLELFSFEITNNVKTKNKPIETIHHFNFSKGVIILAIIHLENFP